MIRTYSEMIALETFEERYEYLKLNGAVGSSTFGHDRWLNQRFYKSLEWKEIRRQVIIRDESNDLAHRDHPIHSRLLIHHMNPVMPEQLRTFDMAVIDPEFLVCVTHNTHNAIHFGDASLLIQPIRERTPGDTILW